MQSPKFGLEGAGEKEIEGERLTLSDWVKVLSQLKPSCLLRRICGPRGGEHCIIISSWACKFLPLNKPQIYTCTHMYECIKSWSDTQLLLHHEKQVPVGFPAGGSYSSSHHRRLTQHLTFQYKLWEVIFCVFSKLEFVVLSFEVCTVRNLSEQQTSSQSF